MPADTYAFHPMVTADLPTVRRWLANPHVVEWWGDAHEQFTLVRHDLDHADMHQFIVLTGDRPFGYIQCYDPETWPPHPFGTQPQGTLGIDQFIGEPDMIDRGHGSAFVRAFAERMLREGAPRVLTDPDPTNTRAVRAYEKAGFAPERIVGTSDSPALLMVRNA